MWKAGSSLVTDRKLQLLTVTFSWSISLWSWWKGLLIHKAFFVVFVFQQHSVTQVIFMQTCHIFSPVHDLYHLQSPSWFRSLLHEGFTSTISTSVQPARLKTISALQSRTLIRLQFYGRRVFSGAAPHLWNHLPEDIKNANSIRKLQTLLFNRTF